MPVGPLRWRPRSRKEAKNRQKIGERMEKIGKKKKGQDFLFFAYFSPLFGNSGFFYSVAGRRGRNTEARS